MKAFSWLTCLIVVVLITTPVAAQRALFPTVFIPPQGAGVYDFGYALESFWRNGAAQVIVVGAPGDAQPGSVFLYDSGTGELLNTLHAENPRIGDRFGSVLGTGGDGDRQLAVAAPGEETVTVFDWDVSTTYTWTHTQGKTSTGFGQALDLRFPWLAIGAPLEDGRGAVHLVRIYSGIPPPPEPILISDETLPDGARFGEAVSIDRDAAHSYLAIGAPGQNRVHIYRLNGANWQQYSALSGPAGFGSRVWIQNDGNDLAVAFDGGIRRFARDGADWMERETISSPGVRQNPFRAEFQIWPHSLGSWYAVWGADSGPPSTAVRAVCKQCRWWRNENPLEFEIPLPPDMSESWGQEIGFVGNWGVAVGDPGAYGTGMVAFYRQMFPINVEQPSYSRAAFDLWPNPSWSVVNITLPSTGRPFSGTVIDILGKEVLQIPDNEAGENVSVDVSNLSPGLYKIRLTDGPHQVSKAFIVQR